MLSLVLTVLLLFATFANCVDTYDFIVVGAGAGGGAVARRLVENGKFSVLLIEAGGMPTRGHDIPAFTPRLTSDRNITFHYQSIPQKHVAFRTKGVVPIVSGKMLGGTTSLNYMFFNRGSPNDWDNWAEATGDDSWKYKNMLKYFKQSEDYKGDFPSTEAHGNNGPITVTRPRYAPGLLDCWLAAGTELGYPVVDPNGFQNLGFSPIEFSKRRGRRVSSFIGYLGPVLKFPNLRILTNTNVTKIIFQDKRAVGVQIISNINNIFHAGTVYATKEIIISAGAYFSPIILQRSGIGPRNLLQFAKIPVVMELPTGANLQAHNVVNLNFAINNESVIFNEEKDLTPENFEFFNAFGDGPFSNIRGATGQALLTSSISRADGRADWPDIQLVMSHSMIPQIRSDPIHLTARSQLNPGEVSLSIAVFLGRPKSRGTVQINPQNILGDPLVDFNYMSDVETCRSCWKVSKMPSECTKRLVRTALRPRYIPITLPACDKFPVKSTAYWICYTQQLLPSVCHPAGSNKMGKRNDPTAVVDSELRVIGIDNLRIVDASVMPFIVNANPQAAVYGIAERAAELILETWN